MKLRALFSVAVFATVGVVGTGVADAAPAPTQHFAIISTSFDEATPATVVAAGPISGTGEDITINGGTDRFVFPDGSITVKHRNTKETETFDEEQCLSTFSQRGTYTITRGSGAYRGASGSGVFKSFGFFQGCDPEGEPTAVLFIVTGHGPLSLP